MNGKLALKPYFLGGQGIVLQPFRVAEQEVWSVQGEHIGGACGDTHEATRHGHLGVIGSALDAHVMRQILSPEGYPDDTWGGRTDVVRVHDGHGRLYPQDEFGLADR